MAKLPISDITVDSRIQSRAKGLDSATVEDYAAHYAGGKPKFPPVVVYQNGEDIRWLSQGFHRIAGAEKAGVKKIDVEIREGGFDDAILDAAASNSTHGLKRTNEDKRLAVRLVLELKPKWSDRQIAEHCGVGQNLPGEIRAGIAAKQADELMSSDDINLGGTRESDGVDSEPTRGRKSQKEEHGAAIARALKVNHETDDETIAERVGCKASLVKSIRKELVKAGTIKAREEAPASPTRPSQEEVIDSLRGSAPPPEESPPEPEADEPAEVDTDPLKTMADDYCRRVREMGRALDEARRQGEELAKEKIGVRMHWQSILQHIQNAKGSVNAGMPAHKCPGCAGTGKDESEAACKWCKAFGYLDRGTYKRACETVGVPDEGGADE